MICPQCRRGAALPDAEPLIADLGFNIGSSLKTFIGFFWGQYVPLFRWTHRFDDRAAHREL